MSFKEQIEQTFKDAITVRSGLDFSRSELSDPENITVFPYHKLDCSMTQLLKNRLEPVVRVGEHFVTMIIISLQE